MHTRLLVWACAILFGTAPSFALGAPDQPRDLLAGITPEHAELAARIRLASAMRYADEMRALMTAYDQYEIDVHMSESLELPPGRSSVRSWKNERNARWTHTITIRTAYVDGTQKLFCKNIHEELAVQVGDRAIGPPAVRDATACKPLRGGIMVEGSWKIHRSERPPVDATVPSDKEHPLKP